MKFFECDWNKVFQWLPLWEKLSPNSRRHFLLPGSNTQPVLEDHYAADLETIVAGGLVERVGSNRVRPATSSIEFRRIMRQLEPFPLFDASNLKSVLDDYKRKHFFTEELNSVYVAGQWVSSDDQSWLDRFLSASSLVEWEKPLRSSEKPAGYSRWQFDVTEVCKHTYVTSEDIGVAAQFLVRRALESPSPLPMLLLIDILPENLRPHVAAAFKAAVRYRLLFPALRFQTAEPAFWIHPEMGHYLHRPKPKHPAAVTVTNLVAPAILPGDMAVVLIEVAGGECRLKREGGGSELFSKVQAKIMSALPSLPLWLEHRFKNEDRLLEAGRILELLKFVAKCEIAGRKRVLQATNAGLTWIRQPPEQRIHDLAGALDRPSKVENFYFDDFRFVPGQSRFFSSRNKPLDLSPLVKRIWAEASAKQPVPLTEFISYHARESHPLTDPALRSAGLLSERGYGAMPLSDLESEKLWESVLTEFFWERLVAFGAVDTGLDDQKRLCFRLNAVGEFLLGRADDIRPALVSSAAGLVVQPNFEIVFLQPNPVAEVDLSLFAERIGKGVGTLFRITRRSIIQAAAKGSTAQQVLGALARHASKNVPANVLEEIRAWVGACRPLPIRRTWLIEAPDRETAVRVQKILGTGCTFVADTLLEIGASTLQPATRKALSEAGLFLAPSKRAAKASELENDEEEDF